MIHSHRCPLHEFLRRGKRLASGDGIAVPSLRA